MKYINTVRTIQHDNVNTSHKDRLNYKIIAKPNTNGTIWQS